MSPSDHGRDSPPPDTPAWSAPRRRVITRTWWLGTAMIIAGIGLGVLGQAESLAGQLLDAGVTTVVGSAVIYVGGASGERAAAWLALARRRDQGRFE